MAYRTIITSESRNALNVTLDRFDRRNALNSTSFREISDALDAAEASPNCRLFVLRGGDGVFCSGMDLEEVEGAESRDELSRFFQLLRRFTVSSCLVVSIVDGRAEGGGVGLVAASDFVFATRRATFGLPEALWGLLPSSVLPFLLRRIGFRMATTMTLSTLPIDAVRAEQVGLVDVLDDQPERPLRRLAARVTKIDPSVTVAAKRAFRRLEPITQEVETASIDELGQLLATPVAQRAINGFRGDHKRLPWDK